MGKTKITQEELKNVLTAGLKLKEPVFKLEHHGTKVSGSIVSDTFAGWDDARRQHEIWNTLKKEYNSDSVALIGVLLAYTTTEWNVVLD